MNDLLIVFLIIAIIIGLIYYFSVRANEFMVNNVSEWIRRRKK